MKVPRIPGFAQIQRPEGPKRILMAVMGVRGAKCNHVWLAAALRSLWWVLLVIFLVAVTSSYYVSNRRPSDMNQAPEENVKTTL